MHRRAPSARGAIPRRRRSPSHRDSEGRARANRAPPDLGCMRRKPTHPSTTDCRTQRAPRPSLPGARGETRGLCRTRTRTTRRRKSRAAWFAPPRARAETRARASHRLLLRLSRAIALPREQHAAADDLERQRIETALRRSAHLRTVDREATVVTRAEIVVLTAIERHRASEVRAHGAACVERVGPDAANVSGAEDDIARGRPRVVDHRRDDLDFRRDLDEARGRPEIERLARRGHRLFTDG